ncbi:putative virus X resistance protein-like, coiled-coil [Helianthus annuus]|nr:putative virus X resistance protein-like, coiled-coil [Helianthus annuus]
MAEIVLSAFLNVLFEKLASAALKTIASYKGIDAEIKKWHRSLKQIQRVLADASRKEITDDAVKEWLNDLQHLAYDIDDVLDDLATEAMHREFNHEPEAIASKVRRLIPTCCTNFSRSARMHDKLDSITAKLKDLVEEKAALGLTVGEETRPKVISRRLQTSMVDASSIIGRQVEKEALVHRLLEDEPCDQNLSILPIVGMGGVGKTTLARLLYNEKQVKDRFELKAWACVSGEFDSFAISEVIYQSVAGVHKEFADLNLLQVDLVKHLRGKRFLLVLDDVWSESPEDWKTLVGPFHACAPGSKVSITTRKEQLLRRLGYGHLNQLRSLSHDDALSLFALHALGVDNFDSHVSLKPHGEAIVKKCDGLPLALITLGTSLRTKEDEDSWKKVLESEIWKLPVEGEIIPALKLSYHDLSAPLKRLFVYCSLFPKDFLFDKEQLVLLWMAEGFLQQPTPSDSTEESLGHEYFDELFSRSFFQHAPDHESFFVMHDLMNDLATSVATEFFVRLDNETEKNIRKEMLEKYRHMSFVREPYVTYKKFEELKISKSLRTFLATSIGVIESWQHFYLSNRVLVDLLHELPLLRVLCLSNFEISEVPSTIGTLRHLRYLNLSRTRITHLPEKLCNLYNLQTLIVVGCRNLAKLPNNFLKLKNLRHLDIRDTPLLDKMPLGISELKSLRTLSKIIIGGKSGFEVTKLEGLENLCGKVSIVGLDKVQNARDARVANFSQKRLSELEVVWTNVSDNSRNEILEKEVLNELKPHNDKLIQLKIKSYGGLEFPNWVGNPSFGHLRHMSILGCKKCTSLPAFGQLPSLKQLFIKGLDGVRVVGMEFLGTGRAFPSLEILSFKQMPGWEKWANNTSDVFPCLKQLLIRDCHNLVQVKLEALPSLHVLEIYGCPNLVDVTLQALPSLNVLKIVRCDNCVLRRLVEIANALTKLEIECISGLNDVVWRGAIEYLGAIEDLSIFECNEIRYLWESEAMVSKILMNLRILIVSNCNNLVSLGEKEEDNYRSNFLTSLRLLLVSYCDNMKRCICPDNVETLGVVACSSITTISLPTGGQKLKSLNILYCNKLSETEWGGQKMNNNNNNESSMLEYVHISGWPNLKSIIELKYLVHLTELRIINCETLESFPDNELANMTSLQKLEIRNCPSMDACFPRGVWPPNLDTLEIGKLNKPISEWGPQNFPTSLVKLYLYGGDDGVSSCSQFSHLLPPSLTYLKIDEFNKLESVSTGLQHLTTLKHLHFDDCPNLNKVSNLQHLTSLRHLSFDNCPHLNNLSHTQRLTSLKHLSFYDCPKMMDLPETLLPSLLSLTILGDCPKLKERCSKRGCYWPLIWHIPYIRI